MINIADDILYIQRLGLLDKLLYDRTAKRAIIWGSEAHTGLGEAYKSGMEIRPELITGDRSGVIKTRARKAMSQRSDRTRKNGEVFTPLRICRKMIDYADEMLRCGEDGARGGKAAKAARGGKSAWQRYADLRVMEITCGEAPYLASRYDVATGEEIPPLERAGLLDRKLRAVDEHAASEGEWLKWAFRAFEACYGYELQGDNLLIARVNMFMTFAERLRLRWNREPGAKECRRLIKIITWNLWQADGLTGRVPRFELWYGESRQRGLFDGIEGCADGAGGGEAPYCRIFDWRSRRSFEYGALAEKGGKGKMKFDFIIGNPPYQEDNEISRRSSPIYPMFMDAAYKLGTSVELITPARFLFNAGQTRKEWNQKMLDDEHLKVLYYEPDGSKIFPSTDIKGGVAITYRDATKHFGKIGTFTSFDELNRILGKVVTFHNGNYINSIISNRGMYRFSDEFFRDYPLIKDRIAAGTGNMLTSKVFFDMPECFEAEKIDSSYLGLYGRNDNRRVYRYIKRKYIIPNDFIDTYNVLVPESNGSGAIGEVLSTPIIGQPAIGHTDTFLSIGQFKTEAEAEACLKYIKTKFVRAMLSILKVTQDNPPSTWRYVPLQDFTSSSDIDWSKSVAEIDRQLYAKYGLSEEEINFIETRVKEMA